MNKLPDKLHFSAAEAHTALDKMIELNQGSKGSGEALLGTVREMSHDQVRELDFYSMLLVRMAFEIQVIAAVAHSEKHHVETTPQETAVETIKEMMSGMGVVVQTSTRAEMAPIQFGRQSPSFDN